jgi:hypothetical protein
MQQGENVMAKKEQNKPRPVEKLRAYPVQAAIWRNESENGVFHSVTFSRVYKDGDDYKDVDSYSGTQLLQLAHLAPKAYDRAEALTRKAREAANDGQADEDAAEAA